MKSSDGEILPLAAGHRALALAAGVLELHDGEQGEDWREESVKLIALSGVNVFSPSSPCNALFSDWSFNLSFLYRLASNDWSWVAKWT